MRRGYYKGMPEVIVEFYGIPRERAGRAELMVRAATVGAALAEVERRCPGLRGLLQAGRLAEHYRLSLDGREFLTDCRRALADGARLLLLSADAGG
ncbi:MAG: MoaD/ThiS family protein [Gemmataceae bacterium]|nr:MoaD/ThiS family protein [Gemmataceae bacterium]